MRLLRWTAFTMLLACAPTEPVDTTRCVQATSGFGNIGCTVIIGRVLGSDGAPLVNVSVGPRPSLDGSQFNTPYDRTGADGRFALRLTRYSRGESDSVSLWIRAHQVPLAPGEPSVGDSVFVRARVAPPNSVPDTVAVEITLPVS